MYKRQTVLIIYNGSHAVDNGTMQVGNMMAFMQYAMQIIMSFLMITMMSIMLPRASVSAKRINEIMKEYRKEYFAEGQLFYFLKAHNYSTYYGCGIETMTEAHYQMTLPDDEYIFGNNSK